MRVFVTIDDRAVLAGLRAVERESSEECARILRHAAKKVLVPQVRRVAPRIVAATIVAKSDVGGVAITTNAHGQLRAIFVLLQDGGIARAPIYPKGSHTALKFGGRYTANVKTPRHYRGKHFLEKGVGIAMPRYGREVEDQVSAWMARHIN